MPVARVLVGSLAVAALSSLLVAPAPSYDPWAWLLWGRELGRGELSTAEGPAFKPLPVAVCALLGPLGSAAPWLWVLVARAGAVAAAWLAFGLGRRLAGGSPVAGALAATGVALCGSSVWMSAAGLSEALLVALALAGAEAWRAGRERGALACGVGCALLRVESWPFLLAFGVWLWRRRAERPLLVAGALAVPALWLVPELIGSGDAWRSGARARIPNAGQPALADVPALTSLEAALRQPLWPLWAGLAVLALAAWRGRAGAPGGGRGKARWSVRGRPPSARTALAPAAAGLAWIALVGAMAQAGFSGEPRYALPGAALVSLSGAIGLAAVARPLAAVVALGAVLAAAAPKLAELPALRERQAFQWELASDLRDAVALAGGRRAVLACGRPYVGRLRGPLMAYRLAVAKRRVEPDDPPRAPGVVFRSALRAGAPVTPPAPRRFRALGRAGRWHVLAACRASRTPG